METVVGTAFERKYTLRVNRACCGRVSNCCAPSCCFSEAIYDILDPAGESLGVGCAFRMAPKAVVCTLAPLSQV